MSVYKIEITFSNLDNESFYVILPMDCLFNYNGKTIPIKKNHIEDILRILRNWKPMEPSNTKLDNETCIIKIYDRNVTTLKYVGNFPNDYAVFKKLVGELCQK